MGGTVESASMARLLVVDDEPGICRAITEAFRGTHEVASAPSAEAALERLAAAPADLVLLDVGLPGMSGLDFLTALKARPVQPPVIVFTAQGSMATAVEAVKRGAFEFIMKPLDLDMIQILVDRALDRARLSAEVARLRASGRVGGAGELIGTSLAMQEVYKRIGAVAGTPVSVLLSGESGTGKELAARAVHAHSDRAAGPFVAVNCAALPETLLHSELFGHEKGAFTGAVAQRAGRFEAAHGGTLFLDEIAEMPLALQGVLLRVLETRSFERLGGTQTVKVDVRLVAASNVDLAARVAEGRFREDLFYRLHVVSIRLPPLRERLEDLPLLVAHFLEQSGSRKHPSQEFMAALARHTWPGNVRELRNAVSHAAVLATGDTLLPEHLPARAPLPPGPAGTPNPEAWLDPILAQAPPEGIYEAVLDAVEKPLLARIMAQTGGNQVQAARRLGIHRTTLRAKLERHGLTPKGTP